MSQYKSDFDASQGSPNTSALQYLQEQLTPEVISSMELVCRTVVSGSAGVEADIPMGAEIIGISVLCLKSNGSGTMTVKTNADTPVTISNAIACVTADVIAYAGTIDSTYQVVGADGISIFGNGTEDYGVVYIKYLK
jgi:hypothetical protein